MFRGHDVERDRVVAIKLFKLDVRPERVHQLVGSFERLVAAELTHPAIAAPIATGIAGVSAYLASEYISGEAFDLAIREYGPAPAPDALRVAAQLAGALDFAAVVNVHHGALHPRDVLLAPGETRVTGIGVAHALEQIGLATPLRRPYSAPERMAGTAWDRRADVFALAALMHELLWGRRITGVGAQVADALTEIPQGDLVALQSVFARALAENPADRYESALEFAEALKNAFPDVALAPPPLRRQTEVPAKSAAAPKTVEAAAPTIVVPPKKGQPVTDGDLLPLSDPEPMPPLPIHAASDTLTIGGEDKREVERDAEREVEREAERTNAIIDAPPFVGAAPIDAAPDLDLRAAEEARYADVETAPAVVPEVDDRVISSPVTRGMPPREPARDILGTLSAVDRRDAARGPGVDIASTRPRSRSRSGVLVAMALLFGLGLGFAAALMLLSQRSPDVAPQTVEATPSQPQAAPSSAPARSAPATPAAQTGREFTESAVPPPVAPQPPASQSSQTAAPRSPASTAAPVSPNTAAAVPPKADAARFGRLLVRTTPAGAMVFIDGRDAGRTPIAVRELSPGTHRVRIVRDGYVAVERRVVISAARPAASLIVPLVTRGTEARGTETRGTEARGTEARGTEARGTEARGTEARGGTRGTDTRSAALPAGSVERFTGTVDIDSRPTGAKVYLDNKLVGTTPLSLRDVRAGEHAVRLEHDGYRRWTSMVRVVAAERNRVTASLER